MSKPGEAWPHPPPRNVRRYHALQILKKAARIYSLGHRYIYEPQRTPAESRDDPKTDGQPFGPAESVRSCAERMKKKCRKKFLKHHCLGDKISQRFSVLWPLDSIRQHIKVQHHGKETRDICQIYQTYLYHLIQPKGLKDLCSEKNKKKIIIWNQVELK